MATQKNLFELPRYKTNMNAHLFPIHQKKSTMPSMTVPDQTMSLMEIVERFASGRTISANEGVYNDDPDMPNLQAMDKVERAEYLQNLNTDMQRISNEIREIKATRIKKANDEVEKKLTRLKELEKQSKEVAGSPASSGSEGKRSAPATH